MSHVTVEIYFLIEISKKAIFSPKEALVIAKDPEMAIGSELPVYFRSKN